MEQETSEIEEPANLRFLRRLVTVLTAVMIVGLLTLVALIVIRMFGTSDIALPNTITLPDGAAAVAFTQTKDWYAVVTDGNQILVFDRTNGSILQTITVDTP